MSTHGPVLPVGHAAGAVSVLRAGDEKFHYSDGSHRWTAPDPEYDQEVWEEQVRQHKLGHLRNERPRVRIRRIG